MKIQKKNPDYKYFPINVYNIQYNTTAWGEYKLFPVDTTNKLL